MTLSGPDKNCLFCSRLSDFRKENRQRFPEKYNAPVPSFGSADARLLIVGLAPGLRGANFTGRPFTGDFAGELLYSTLLEYGFATGKYSARPDDALELRDCRITNAVRCVPPGNKPAGAEISACNRFLTEEITSMTNLRVILCLGRISHDAVLKACGLKRANFSFSHGSEHELSEGKTLIDSYHCSRYNTQTKRLTFEMFAAIFDKTVGRLT